MTETEAKVLSVAILVGTFASAWLIMYTVDKIRKYKVRKNSEASMWKEVNTVLSLSPYDPHSFIGTPSYTAEKALLTASRVRSLMGLCPMEAAKMKDLLDIKYAKYCGLITDKDNDLSGCSLWWLSCIVNDARYWGTAHYYAYGNPYVVGWDKLQEALFERDFARIWHEAEDEAKARGLI